MGSIVELPMFENTIVHDSTGFTPFELTFWTNKAKQLSTISQRMLSKRLNVNAKLGKAMETLNKSKQRHKREKNNKTTRTIRER